MKIIIAGGNGSLGRRLAEYLSPEHDLAVLTRIPQSGSPVRQIHWDAVHVGDWAPELEGPDTAVINLAGKLVDCRPTARNIAELTSSRVNATRALVRASWQLKTPVTRWVQASTTAIWSDAGETRCVETTPVPDDGLPQMTGVARAWEEAFIGANTSHGVVLRTSIVLDPDSPALSRLVALTKYGLGGTVGSGAQWFSWIHLTDWLAVVRASLGLSPGLHIRPGIVVAAAPYPARNHELMAALRALLRRPGAPTPALLLKMGAAVLRTDAALGLTGRHVTSEVLDEAGFVFAHPRLTAALADLLRAGSSA